MTNNQREKSSPVSYELKDGIGFIRIENPPLNAIGHAEREGLCVAVERALQDNSKAVILYCAGDTFTVGADIAEFDKPVRPPLMPDVLMMIDKASKPFIAAMHGMALGGGLEAALACHYRCALSSTRLGLPEVNLGLLPGAGGTQRLSRLVGVETALNLTTQGQSIHAQEALTIGVVDYLIGSDDLLQGALDYTKTVLSDLSGGVAKLRRASDIIIDPDSVPAGLFEMYRNKLDKRTRGQLAPQHIVSCVEAAVTLPFDEGIKKERELFVDCQQSSQSIAMRHLFFAERKAAKIKGLPKNTATRDIKTVAVIGGGTMGGGIAMNFANAGIPVTLLEINEDALQRGLGVVERNYQVSVNKGKLSENDKRRCLSLIQGSTDYAALADVDLVIEAVFENLDIKRDVFAKLDSVCKPGAILATNTSYQDINLIAEVTQRPQDVIGLHFFSPANVMKLLEVVRADKTADDVVASAMVMAKKIKKVTVLARVCYGFIANRMLRHYAREAQLCLIEGATPEQIDDVMQRWGMAMGPLAMSDLTGLDVGYRARQGLTNEEKGDPKTYCIADALVEAGRLGQKSGCGYYRYDEKTRARQSDTDVMRIVEAQSKAQGVIRRNLSDDEILQRLIFSLVNEGAAILAEGIAQRASDIDVIYANGYGFPRHRGGPMQYADTVGLIKVRATIAQFYDRFAQDYWRPAELLESLANQNMSFRQWDSEQLLSE